MTWNNYLYGLWTTIYIFLSVKILITNRRKKKWIILISFLPFSFLFACNKNYTTTLNGFLIYLLLSIQFLYINFSENKTNLLATFSIIYFIQFSFEILFQITLFSLHITRNYYEEIAIFSEILTLLFVCTFKEEIKWKITNTYFYTNRNLIFKSIFTNLSLLLILLYKIPLSHFLYSPNEWMTLVLFSVVFNLFIILLREKEKTNALNKDYQKTLEYSEFTEGLLSEYKSFLHEYKNKLIVIKSLANSKKELHKYIDSILEEKAINNYRWLLEIKNIPISGVKGLINYKLLKMRELNIEIEVYISEEISKLKENCLNLKEKNDLYSILGIILDNAIEASLESKEKLASFHFYIENQEIIILLANTFKTINIDRLEEKGYSSKGKNRGYGLFMLNEIIKHNDIFKKETNIIDNFFVQKISIKTKK